jgi:hypothetical protein
MFAVDQDRDELRQVREQSFSDLGVLERPDFQEWIVERPSVLGEEFLVIQSEYSKFADTRDRLDLLALDREGRLVVVELKRDEADDTTDLQAIKYASYCATLTAEEIQQDHRSFWKGRGEELSPEEVGRRFVEFLDEGIDGEVPITEEGWAAFDLDDKPRILLVAGSFGIQVTAPVMWLIEEYDLDIMCVTIHAYRHEGEVLLDARQVIPVPEAEEYMTRRREKQEKQSRQRRKRAIKVLLDCGVLVSGDVVRLNEEQLPQEPDEEVGGEFYKAEVTGKTGRSDNFRWLYDGEEHSATGLAKTVVEKITGDRPGSLNGYKYLLHPEFDDRTLSDLRNSGVEALERR